MSRIEEDAKTLIETLGIVEGMMPPESAIRVYAGGAYHSFSVEEGVLTHTGSVSRTERVASLGTYEETISEEGR